MALSLLKKSQFIRPIIDILLSYLLLAQKREYTAIFFAAERGHLNIVEELLKHDAKTETKVRIPLINYIDD